MYTDKENANEKMLQRYMESWLCEYRGECIDRQRSVPRQPAADAHGLRSHATAREPAALWRRPLADSVRPWGSCRATGCLATGAVTLGSVRRAPAIELYGQG